VRLLREPLLHFLLIGAALFAVYHLWPRDTRAGDVSNRIVLTPDDLRQLSVTWLAQGRPPPTAEQMQNLVEARVQEEILYREALAMGLDKNDTIVKRRLAQKMEFLFEDVAALRDPTRDELTDFFAKHAERFALPARVTFQHLYFSPDRRGANARRDAESALAKLGGKGAESPGARALGDPFMFESYYGDRSFDQLAKDFGPGFARALLGTAVGSWQGPIESGYGWHLVFVDSITPSHAPDFEAVELDVKNEWIEAQRADVRKRAYAAMRAHYEIELPSDWSPDEIARAPLGPLPPVQDVAPQ
jgi:hypothetical protein